MVKPEVAASFKNILSLDAIKEMDVKIGMRRGASYSDEYEALLFDPVFASKLVTLSNARQAIQLTNAGRIAGFIGNPQIIKFEAMKACIESEYEQVYDLLANENSETYLIYSKKTVDVPLVTRIDSAMREVDSASDKFNENYIPPSFSCD
jgi:ABC-type amino acid transport substrate-binding protein